jgi:hypothetical protein
LNIFTGVELLISLVLFTFGNRWKSNGARSGPYGECGRLSQTQVFKKFTVAAAL